MLHIRNTQRQNMLINFIIDLPMQEAQPALRKSQSSQQMRPIPSKVTNFKTINYHQGMNNSSYYKTMLSTHLLASSADPHALQCANETYTKAFRSRSVRPSSRQDTSNPKKNPQSTYEEKSVREEKEGGISNLFTGKVEEKPHIQKELRQQMDEKRSLQLRIVLLRKQIADEKKRITKISLACDHSQNHIQLISKHTRELQEINRDLAVQIDKCLLECKDLSKEVQLAREDSAHTKIIKEQERALVIQLHNYNTETQVELRRQNREFNLLKGREMRQIKKMVGSHSYQSQLQEQKAAILNQIHNNYARNHRI